MCWPLTVVRCQTAVSAWIACSEIRRRPGCAFAGPQRENARFDIGPVFRTLGDPRLRSATSSRSLKADSRSAARATSASAPRATTLAYRSAGGRTSKVDGMDAQSSGTMWIDAAEGAVIRTNLRVLRPSAEVAASITVDFQDPRLGAWVPWQMTEHYSASNGETMTGMASAPIFGGLTRRCGC
jgi:hypothetical protein